MSLQVPKIFSCYKKSILLLLVIKGLAKSNKQNFNSLYVCKQNVLLTNFWENNEDSLCKDIFSVQVTYEKKQVRKDISIQNEDSMKNIHLRVSEVAASCAITGHIF